MYWSAVLVALTPPGVVTVTSTVPADCAGTVAVIWVSDTTVKPDAGTEPNSTADAPVNPLPDIVRVAPPLSGPADGETAVNVAECDSALADCYSGQEGPYSWTFTLNAAQIADLANGLAKGSIDFGYRWDQNTPPISDPFFGDSNGYDLQYVEAGPATIGVSTPEPATVLFCFCGIAGIVALRRRFRKV